MTDLSAYFKDMGRFDVLTPEEEAECSQKLAKAFEALVGQLLRTPYAWRLIFERWERIKALGRASNKLAEEYGNAKYNAADLTKQVDENIKAAMTLAEDDFHRAYNMYADGRIAFHFKAAGLSKNVYMELIPDVLDAPDSAAVSPERVQRIKDLQAEIEKCRHKLVNANLRLVVSFSKKFNGYGIDLPDLIQEGNIGLMRAVEKFDPSREFKFSTYAAHWIRQSFIKALKRQGKTIRLPSHIYDTLGKVEKVSEELYTELDRAPTTKELSDKLGVEPALMERIAALQCEPLSLEVPVAGLSDNSREPKFFKDLVQGESPDPLEEISSGRRDDAILHAVRTILSPVEQQVVIFRYGLGGHPPHTFERIAGILGKSRERIRQLESAALKKLREHSTHLEEYNE